MSIKVYQYPKCSTCRDALKWLDEHEVEYEKVDLVAHPPTAVVLKELHRRSGKPITRFFNTTGESYRKGNFRERLMTLTENESIAALAKDGKLIKRPIIDTGKQVLVGFDEAIYARTLK